MLRAIPYSETSCIVQWLTRDHGRLNTILKGAYRPRSDFAGQFDLFYTCEVLFYHRFPGELHVTREVTGLKTRSAFRTDWRAMACASYAVDLAARSSPPEAPHPAAYVLLEATLDDLARAGGAAAVVFWYELRLLQTLGLAPQLNRCNRCGRDIAPFDRDTRFQSSRGGLLCAVCARDTARDLAPIAPDVMALLADWQRCPGPAAARRTRSNVRQVDEVSALLGAFVAYHLDTPPTARRICLDLLARKPAGNGCPPASLPPR